MDDYSEKMVGKTPKQLLGAGARAYATGNYNAAVQYLSRASELTVSENGSHTHDSLGEVYFLYGKSLLELSREEGDPLGDVVPKDIAVAQEAEEEPAEGQQNKSDDDDEEEGTEGSEEGEDEDEGEQEEEEGEEDEEDDDEEESNEEGKSSNDEKKVGNKVEESSSDKTDEKINKAEKKDKEEVVEGSAKGVEFNGIADEDSQNESSKEKLKGESSSAGDCVTITEDKPKDGDTEDKSEAGASDEKPVGTEDEQPSDLQVAWEVLELAKIIFTKRGDDAKSDLAETLIALGEVSLESENFESAVNDIRAGLELQYAVCDKTDRALAETHYKLGMALSMNDKMDEAIENFNKSIQFLKDRIEELKDSTKFLDKKEVDEMKNLIPEIEEKIVDLKNYNEEIAKKASGDARPILPGSPEKKATDISHLVKRKRKSSEDGEGTSNEPKKPSLNL